MRLLPSRGTGIFDASPVVEDPGFAVDVTLSECRALNFGRVVGGDSTRAGQEFLVGFILGGDGRADPMAESSS